MVNNRDIAQQAQLALAIIEDLGPDGESFVRRWMGFNAFYNAFVGHSERDCLMAAITNSMRNEQAQRVIDACQGEISYFAHLPPGNMRRMPSDPEFRKRSAADMHAACNEQLPPQKD